MPLVARTPVQTRKGRCPVVKESFGMYNIRIHCAIEQLFGMYHICTHRTVLKQCMSEKKKKKEDEQINIFMFGFLDLVKGYYKVSYTPT